MLKRNLFLINCWLAFIVFASLGKMVSVYQEWADAPPIVISFSSLENASETLKTVSQNFKTREGRYKEEVVAYQRLTLENEMNKEEDKLSLKTKNVLAKLKPLHHKAKTQTAKKLIARAQPKAKPVVHIEEDELVVVNTQKEIQKPVELHDGELFAINNEAPFEEGAIKAKTPRIIKTAALFVPIAESFEQKLAEQELEVEAVEEEKLVQAPTPAPKPSSPTLDKIETAQAAPERAPTLASQVASDDEPIFLDYSEEAPDLSEPPSLEKLAEKIAPPPLTTQVVGAIPTQAKMSSTVERAIARQLNTPKSSPKTIVLDSEGDDELQVSTQAPATRTPFAPEAPVASAQKAVSSQSLHQELDEEAQEKEESATLKEARLALSSIQVDLNQGQGRALNNFEFELAYDTTERLYDQGSGLVDYKIPLYSSSAVLDGRLVHKDSVRTRATLALQEGLLEMEVPTFSISSLEKFLEQEKLKGEGGFLLIDVQNGVQQTLIDAEFEKSFFLNEDFVKTASAQEARYHFYVGVEPGNVLVTYQLKNKKSSQKVLFVGLDEMSFDAAEFAPERVRKLALYEQKLFGAELSDLQLDPQDLRYFNTNNTASLQGLNFYELSRPALPLGMREYFEVGTKRDSIFVGNSEAKSLELPAIDFRDAVLDSQGLNDLNGACLLQLNLRKKLKEVRVLAEAGRGPMNLAQSYLGKNGEFSSELDSTSTRAFFVGYEQGVVNYRLDYLDGSSDTFQSFCSLGSYIVEQL